MDVMIQMHSEPTIPICHAVISSILFQCLTALLEYPNCCGQYIFIPILLHATDNQICMSASAAICKRCSH